MDAGTRVRDVVGRELELGRLAAFLDRVEGGPAGVVLEGEAGVGKTELWRAAVASGRGRGFGVLAARPAEAERGLAFAGLADLLAGMRDEIASLPGPQRRPLSVALLLEDAGSAPLEPRAIAVGVLEVLHRLAGSAPLLVAIDDVQWLDRASGAALSYALRRASAERVGVLLAQRTDSAASLVLDGVGVVERVVVGPLSLGAMQRLLGDRLEPVFPRSTVRRIHERSGGNPFFALELALALEAHGKTLAPGEELPVPGDLNRLVQARLEALPSGTAEPLAAVAALAEPTLALLDDDAGVDPAFAAGMLVLDGDRVRFAHPLLAAAAYERIPPHRRRVLHRRLADVVADSEQRARHLALAAHGPDPRLAALLEEAAAHAHTRGAPETAADLAERALQLDDGSDSDATARRTAVAAGYHMLGGDDRRARELLEHAMPVTPAGSPHARLLCALGSTFEGTDLERAIALYEAALAEAGDELLKAEILGTLGLLLTADRRPADGEPYLRAAVAAGDGAGDPALLARALSSLAVNRFLLGRGVDAALMKRALELEPQCDPLRINDRPVTRFGWMCKHAGDVDRSRLLLEEACRIGDARGDSGVMEPLFYSCFLELYADDWQRGVRIADRICHDAAETERDDALLHGLSARSVLLAHLGDEAGARRDERDAVALAELVGSTHGSALGGMALGVLELSLDRPAEALRLARRSTECFLADGVEEPAMYVSFPVHAEAAIARGELEEAERLLEWIEERAVRLDREWALACAARCRGLLAAAYGDEAGAVAAFERALAEHARVQYRRFDLGRTLLAQGEMLRRFKRKRLGREAIEAAIGIFDGLDAALWSVKARRELARISGRRSAEGLTATEHRVAELVIAGLPNKQVASQLHVTVRTVESNLTRIYAKLGVHSRGELARRLSS